ncbi:hypothetical protein SDC9_84397 [bioreactor metagenome]|uniref:Uncharacterized protein n=1 Tax=bioreactor metagenome TaxID=1076179 RepID=A0A644ZBX7_9ZZZZ
MLHIVAAPVLLAPHADEAVVRNRARKAELAPGGVVLHIVQRDGGIFHQGFQRHLAEPVREIRVRGVGEIALEHMAHHIGYAVGQL